VLARTSSNLTDRPVLDARQSPAEKGIVGIRYQATTSTDIRGLIRAAVISKLCKSVRLLELHIVPIYKSPLSPINIQTQCLVTKIVTIWNGCMKYNILYKGDGLRLIILACYSWERVLNFGLDVSFDNV
jgi:hypothetical protein